MYKRKSIHSAGIGAATRTLNPPGPPRTPKPIIPIQDPPTLLEITSANPREVYAGKKFFVQFRTDADPNYFANPDSFIAVINPPTFGQFTGTTSIREGYGTAYFIVNEEIEVGDIADITFELRPPRARTLSDSVQVKVVEPPTTGSGQGTQATTPNINPSWVNKDEPNWRAWEWDENSVAIVMESDESIDIFVSSENKRLNKLIVKAQRRDEDAVESIRNFYLEHISFHAFLANAAASAMSHQEEMNEASIEDFVKKEISRTCETVCGIIEELFDFLITSRLTLTRFDGHREYPV